MRIIVSVSTLLIFLLCLIFTSLTCYTQDFNFTAFELLFSFIISIPITFFANWMRDVKSFTDN